LYRQERGIETAQILPLPVLVSNHVDVIRNPVLENTELLIVSGISRSFGGLRALSDLSLTINSGEILGIIGPNGAGKTTLFNTLNGLIRPQRGRINFGTRNITRLRPNQICTLGIGRTFQQVRAFPHMNLMENVVVGAFVHARRDADALAAARNALRTVGLEALCECQADRLTNYQLRLMELARALAGRPQLLLMDEPFAGLAAEEIEVFMRLIRSLRDGGLTIAVIEHTMHAMVRLADRFVVLDHGSVIASGAPQMVIRDSTVIKAYLGDKWAQHADA
jgi:ABC-type branched-subunit amino acid transport system ATPase component